MRKYLFTIALGVSILGHVSLATPTNHVDMTGAILDFLSRTELCLNSCRDAASAAEAIPQLKELKEECARLVETQRQLPEPTVQDYMAVQNKMEAFSTLWAAIRSHIERMEQEQILTPELREILHIAPVSQKN